MRLGSNEIQMRPNRNGNIELWQVKGVEGWWPTKIAAEAVARQEFPTLTPDQRYARISYKEFLNWDDL